MSEWGEIQVKLVVDKAGIPENPRQNEEPFGQRQPRLDHECPVPYLGWGKLRKPNCGASRQESAGMPTERGPGKHSK